MSNSRKASSVEWLVEQIKKDVNLRLRGFDIDKKSEQAKAMHREEHLETWVESAVQHRKENHYRKKKILFFEEYYNETYGDGKETK